MLTARSSNVGLESQKQMVWEIVMNIDNENFEIYRHEKDLSDLEYYCMECMRDFTVDEFEVDEMVRNGEFSLER